MSTALTTTEERKQRWSVFEFLSPIRTYEHHIISKLPSLPSSSMLKQQVIIVSLFLLIAFLSTSTWAFSFTSSFATTTTTTTTSTRTTKTKPTFLLKMATTSTTDAIPALRRLPTFRSMSSSLSDDTATTTSSAASEEISERASDMNTLAKRQEPFTESEIDGIVHSIQNVCPVEYKIDYDSLRTLLKDVAHLSHKDWDRTNNNGKKLGQILFPDGQGFSSDPYAKQLLDRIMKEGNWDGAVKHSSSKANAKPKWAVLVTGVNGIRKTTSMYQEWFPQLLNEALVKPAAAVVGGDSNSDSDDIDIELLPSGRNSFFRQLDHMIATLCNEDFLQLYSWTSDMMMDSDDDEPPSNDIVQLYTNLKAAVFTRYRTLSELLGACLLREAQSQNINCMMETSGRDVAMFTYVDHFFNSDSQYNKLALHFEINELDEAKSSVDSRMIHEINTGIDAMKSQDIFNVINANAGGPYGSEVLDNIQKESDSVWHSEIMSGKVGKDWYKATIRINAFKDKPWTAQAIKPDGSLGTEFEFAPRN